MALKSKLLASAILLSFPTIAAAEHNQTGLYLGVGGGLNYFVHSDARTTSSPDSTRAVVATPPDHELGFAVSAQVGYQTPFDMRFEFETAYRYNTLQSTIENFGSASQSGASSPYGGANVTATGRSGNQESSLAFMANAIYDINLRHLFKVDTNFTPYVGVGVGAARIEIVGNYSTPYPTPPGSLAALDFGGKQWALAYQGIVGVSYNVSQAITIGVDYRYFAVDLGGERLSITTPSATRVTRYDRDHQNHSLMASIRYNFGGPVAAPAPAAAPVAAVAPPTAAPPAPPPATPRVQTFLVFFDWDSAQLTSAARDTITAAAQAIKSGNVARLEIVGHTDTTGSAQYNQRLGGRRAEAVRDELAKKGVAHGSITTRSAGKTQLRVPTADNVREPQNRRAEIILPPS